MPSVGSWNSTIETHLFNSPYGTTEAKRVGHHRLLTALWWVPLSWPQTFALYIAFVSKKREKNLSSSVQLWPPTLVILRPRTLSSNSSLQNNPRSLQKNSECHWWRLWLFGSILFFPLFFRLFHFFYRKTSFLLSTPMDTDCFWQTCSVLSVLLLLCVPGGSMFFSEQLRKFWSQKRANTSSDGLFLLYTGRKSERLQPR